MSGRATRRPGRARSGSACASARATGWCSEKLSPRSPRSSADTPSCILNGDRLIEPELGADPRHVRRGCRRRNEKRRGVTRSQTDERERDREHQPEQQQRAGESAQHGGRMHALKLHRRHRGVNSPSCAVAVAVAAVSLRSATADVVVYASGTDLESGNPLVTVHSLSRQIQRFALFVTLARYDSALAPAPYAARRWDWSRRSPRSSRFISTPISAGTTASRPPRATSPSRSTRRAIRRPATGAPTDLADVDSVVARRRHDGDVRVSDRRSRRFRSSSASCRFCRRTCSRDAAHADMRRAAVQSRRRSATVRFDSSSDVPANAGCFAATTHSPASLGGPPHLRASS